MNRVVPDVVPEGEVVVEVTPVDAPGLAPVAGAAGAVRGALRPTSGKAR